MLWFIFAILSPCHPISDRYLSSLFTFLNLQFQPCNCSTDHAHHSNHLTGLIWVDSIASHIHPLVSRFALNVVDLYHWGFFLIFRLWYLAKTSRQVILVLITTFDPFIGFGCTIDGPDSSTLNPFPYSEFQSACSCILVRGTDFLGYLFALDR